ncbi:MAG: hypothetical protein ACRDWD_00355 [Acidimicrobiia bacterium]
MRARPLVGLLLSGALIASLVFLAAPVGAGGIGPVPDLKISKSTSGPFLRNNKYNTTAKHQTVKKTTSPGGTKRFYLKVENDSSDTIFTNVVLGAPPGFGCFKVRFFGEGFNAIDDFTSMFNSKFGQLYEPGQVRKFRVEMKARSNCGPGNVQGTVITGFELSGVPFDSDAVKVKLKVV